MKSLNCYSKRKQKKCFFSLKIINISLFILLLIFSISYIAVANNITVKGFELRDLRTKVTYLNEENQSLETNLMTMKAYGNIYDQVKDLNMVAIEDIDYIKLLDSSVAKK
jgi:cell division protein FtsL